MEFEILFHGEPLPTWRPWDRDLSESVPFEDYCRSQPELWPEVFPTVQLYDGAVKLLNMKVIDEVTPGVIVYLNLRNFSTAVYDSEEVVLLDKWHKTYVVELRYTKFAGKVRQHIYGIVPVFTTQVYFNHSRVLQWGSRQDLGVCTLVDEDFIRQNPSVLLLVLDTKMRARLQVYYR